MIVIKGSKIVIKIYPNFLPCINLWCFLSIFSRFGAIPASFSSVVVRSPRGVSCSEGLAYHPKEISRKSLKNASIASRFNPGHVTTPL